MTVRTVNPTIGAWMELSLASFAATPPANHAEVLL